MSLRNVTLGNEHHLIVRSKTIHALGVPAMVVPSSSCVCTWLMSISPSHHRESIYRPVRVMGL